MRIGVACGLVSIGCVLALLWLMVITEFRHTNSIVCVGSAACLLVVSTAYSLCIMDSLAAGCTT